MNLELIKKYEKEFLHMLHGGKVLMGKKDPVTNTIKWYPSVLNPFVETSNTIVVVIDDIYCTYRKALAEGKTVQYNFGNHGINKKDFPNEWKDLDQSIGILADRACPENYRIKPEKPKFKVGDWVVEIHSTTKAQVLELFGNQIRVKFCYPDAIITTDSSDFIPWVPKKGECCWFWNKGTTITILELLEIVEDGNRKYFAAMPNIPHSLGGYYQYCEPFIGIPPTKLQK